MISILDIIAMNGYYKPNEIKYIISQLKPHLQIVTSNTKIKYYNIPCAFDIEASSFYNEYGEKVGLMYEWTFGIYGYVLIGRTWQEFTEMLDALIKLLRISNEKRLIIYVHNLEYDFQFFHSHLEWKEVFAIKPRQPIYAITTAGIEFRCSYKLSGYSLDNLTNQIQCYKIEKLIGNVDHRKIRHSKTELTDKEIAYCINDVKIIMLYIYERIKHDGNITQIPLTKTGYVRKYCRKKCLTWNEYLNYEYKALISSLTLEWKEYLQLKRAFQGGFTHANALMANKVIKDVTSFDITSSYPCVMVTEEFPMSQCEYFSGENLTQKVFSESIKYYCCVFDIELKNIRPKIFHEYYISSSRCRPTLESLFAMGLLKPKKENENDKKKVKRKRKDNKEAQPFKDIDWSEYGLSNAVIVNGRIMSCDLVLTSITNIDYEIIRQCYDFDKPFNVYNLRRYRKSRLPREFVESILKLYNDKTTLKDVEGREVEYAYSKELLNACFGMTCTDIIRPIIVYDNNDKEWKDERIPDVKIEIDRYNKDATRFMFYPWGVWITAYARRNLFYAILECENDYIYSDTDSIKIINAHKHINFINNYNDYVREKGIKAMQDYGLDTSLIEPKTKKGIKKCLGQWNFDGHYSQFKTLGAKRYMVKYSNDTRNKENKRGKYELTVAGLDKEKAVKYMLEKYKEKIFDYFSTDLVIPADSSGSLTHTYIDDSRSGFVTDYKGVTCKYNELTGMHMENSKHSLKDTANFIKYLLSIDTVEVD